jgi:hypothetical protein
MTDTTIKTAEALAAEAKRSLRKWRRLEQLAQATQKPEDVTAANMAFLTAIDSINALAAQPQAEPVGAEAIHYADLTPDEAIGWPDRGTAEDKNRYLRDVTERRKSLAAHPPVAQQGAAEAVAMSRDVFTAVKMAYGHLWHINNEPCAPVPMYSPEKAAYEARKHLRDLLTEEERGAAINEVGTLIGRYNLAPTGAEPVAAPVASPQPVAQGLTTEADLALKALDRTYYAQWVKQPNGYVAGNVPVADLVEVIEFARAVLFTAHPAQADEGDKA